MTRLLGTASVGDYVRQSWLRGAASAFDLRGNTLREYRTYSSPQAADADAIRDDWQRVGEDLGRAVRAQER